MFDLNDFMNENNEDHNKKWPYIPDHLYSVNNCRFWINKN